MASAARWVRRPIPVLKVVRTPPGPEESPCCFPFFFVASMALMRLPWSASIWAILGKQWARESSLALPPYTPSTMAETKLSAASGPMRRAAKSQMDSGSGEVRCLMKGSSMRRSLPLMESRGASMKAGGGLISTRRSLMSRKRLAAVWLARMSSLLMPRASIQSSMRGSLSRNPFGPSSQM